MCRYNYGGPCIFFLLNLALCILWLLRSQNTVDSYVFSEVFSNRMPTEYSYFFTLDSYSSYLYLLHITQNECYFSSCTIEHCFEMLSSPPISPRPPALCIHPSGLCSLLLLKLPISTPPACYRLTQSRSPVTCLCSLFIDFRQNCWRTYTGFRVCKALLFAYALYLLTSCQTSREHIKDLEFAYNNNLIMLIVY